MAAVPIQQPGFAAPVAGGTTTDWSAETDSWAPPTAPVGAASVVAAPAAAPAQAPEAAPAPVANEWGGTNENWS